MVFKAPFTAYCGPKSGHFAAVTDDNGEVLSIPYAADLLNTLTAERDQLVEQVKTLNAQLTAWIAPEDQQRVFAELCDDRDRLTVENAQQAERIATLDAERRELIDRCCDHVLTAVHRLRVELQAQTALDAKEQG